MTDWNLPMAAQLKYLLCALLALTSLQAGAQFYLTGEDPGYLKWNYIETPSYKVIYPRGLDSLGREYARQFEASRTAVGRSAGVKPGEWQYGKTPIILHTNSVTSNASVVWAPKRLDVYTNPQGYETEPLPWIENLALHESRHISQMQLGYKGVHRVLGWIFGEMWQGACAGIYPRLDYLEGDAVITETALSKAGRGRSAGFLNYYMMSFDQGKWRTYNRWYAGSERYDYPDHYAFGYLFYGGVRALYDEPMLSAKLIEAPGKRPFCFISNEQNIIKGATGKRSVKAFPEIALKTYEIWKENAEARRPYTPSDTLTKTGFFDTDYHHPMVLEDGIYVLKHDKSRTPQLIRIDSTGREHFIAFAADRTSCLHPSHDGKRIWWSETVTQGRWTIESYSIIRYRDIHRSRDRKGNTKIRLGGERDLTWKTRYYNPCPSHDGERIAVVEHLTDGRTAAVVLSSKDGSVLQREMAPDSLQLVDVTWLDEKIYASGVSMSGTGVYLITPTAPETVSARGPASTSTTPGSSASTSTTPGGPASTITHSGPCTASQAAVWTCVLAPQPVKIHHLDGDDGLLNFSSDRSGSDEWYTFDPTDGTLYQETSLRYGGEGFHEAHTDGYLYYSLNTLRGQMIARTAPDSLLHRPVDFADIYHYPIADKLSQQEAELAAADSATIGAASAGVPTVGAQTASAHSDGLTAPVASAADAAAAASAAGASAPALSAPRPYSKFGKLFHFHSWAPFYANIDNIKEMSYDYYFDLAGLGVMAASQNELGTAVLTGGYCAHTDPYDHSYWRHSGHLKFAYTGWLPAFELQVDFNDRASIVRHLNVYSSNFENGYYGTVNAFSTVPYLRGKLSVYVPLRFSRGGWTFGLTPRVVYSVSNDAFSPHRDIYYTGRGREVFWKRQENYFKILSPWANQSLSGYLRAYASMGTAESAYYPRWGIGAELGGSFSFWYPFTHPTAFAYLYGYTPGVFSSHGLRLTAKYQQQLRGEQTMFYNTMTSTLPRGYANAEDLLTSVYPRMAWKSVRVTADYAMPFWIGDPSIGGNFMNIRRMVLTPHFDYTRLSGTEGGWKADGGAQWMRRGGELWSVGATLEFDFRSLFCLWIHPTIGVTFSYNGGTLAKRMRTAGYDVPAFYVAPVISFKF